jgi:hypothetical protein
MRHIYPETSYALSKVLGEARQFNRWSGVSTIGLRFSNIMVRADYDRFPTFWVDPHRRKWNLWGYVDESHVTQSVRLALEADLAGADSFITAAADTVMKRPSRELMAEVFPASRLPSTSMRGPTLCSISPRHERSSATRPNSAGVSCSEKAHDCAHHRRPTRNLETSGCQRLAAPEPSAEPRSGRGLTITRALVSRKRLEGGVDGGEEVARVQRSDELVPLELCPDAALELGETSEVPAAFSSSSRSRSMSAAVVSTSVIGSAAITDPSGAWLAGGQAPESRP